MIIGPSIVVYDWLQIHDHHGFQGSRENDCPIFRWLYTAEDSGKFLIKEGGEAIRARSLSYLEIMHCHLFFLC